MPVQEVVRLLLLITTAVFIFASFHRGDARIRPAFWIGAALLAVGVTGAYPSLLAAFDHRKTVFIGAFWPRPWDPRVAAVAYLFATVLGITALLLAGRKTADTVNTRDVTTTRP